MTIQTIPLNKLTVADGNNPRRSMDAAALDGLAASIKADGLLQNLVVRKDGRKFRIVSGERRYRALSLLAERGDIGKDHPVPVEVRGGLSEADALRLATVENIQREQLAPMDEAEAFAALLGEGASLEDVAAKAGVSVLTVKRRVALASLCDEAKALVREGEFSLSVAEALTLATHDQQRALIERLEQGYHYDADDVRGMLTGEKPAVSLAIFPLADYTGTVTADLFADDDTTFFDDAEQFFRLQSEAVEALAAHHREAGAAFVEVLTEGYAAWWQYREADAEDGEAGGVVIHFKPSGRVEVREGLVRRDVRPSVAEETAAAPAAPKPQPEYTGPVVRMVAAHKSVAVMEALLADARKAKEVAVIQMMRGIRYHGRIAVDAHPALAFFATSDRPPVSYSAVERTAQEFVTALGLEGSKRHAYARPSRGAWDVLLGDDKSAEQLYAAVKGLSDSELEQLHLLLTALAFGQGSMEALDTTDSLFNQVAVDLGVDMRDHWRPDEAFLTRRRKDQLEAIAKESGAISRLGRMKDYGKAQLAVALARHFERCAEDDATLPAAMREQGRDWLPDAMRFPAVTADAPAEQEAEDIEADGHDDGGDPSAHEADEDGHAQAAA
jgi:ParB family chromosome partitioning protein